MFASSSFSLVIALELMSTRVKDKRMSYLALRFRSELVATFFTKGRELPVGIMRGIVWGLFFGQKGILILATSWVEEPAEGPAEKQ